MAMALAYMAAGRGLVSCGGACVNLRTTAAPVPPASPKQAPSLGGVDFCSNERRIGHWKSVGFLCARTWFKETWLYVMRAT